MRASQPIVSLAESIMVELKSFRKHTDDEKILLGIVEKFHQQLNNETNLTDKSIEADLLKVKAEVTTLRKLKEEGFSNADVKIAPEDIKSSIRTIFLYLLELVPIGISHECEEWPIIACIDLIIKNPNNEAIQKESTEILRSGWSTNSLINMKFANTLKYSLKTNIKSSIVCKSVLRTIAELCWQSGLLRKEFFKAGIPFLLDRILIVHRENKDVLTCDVQALAALIELGSSEDADLNVDKQGVDAFLRMGIPSRICYLLKSTDLSSALQGMIFRALSGIARANSEGCKVVSKAVNIDQVLGIMNKSINDAAKQILGYRLLSNLDLSHQEATNQQLSNIVMQAFKAMESHRAQSQLQAVTFKLFRNLATISDEAALLLLRLDVLEKLIETMDRHENVPQVQYACCYCLAKLAWAIGTEREIIDSGILQNVIRAMRKFPENNSIQRDGCWVLRALSADLLHGREIFQTEENITVIVSALENHPNDNEVQTAACGAIANAAREEGYANYFIQERHKLVGILHDVVVTHKDDLLVNSTARSAIRAISSISLPKL